MLWARYSSDVVERCQRQKFRIGTVIKCFDFGPTHGSEISNGIALPLDSGTFAQHGEGAAPIDDAIDGFITECLRLKPWVALRCADHVRELPHNNLPLRRNVAVNKSSRLPSLKCSEPRMMPNGCLGSSAIVLSKGVAQFRSGS